MKTDKTRSSRDIFIYAAGTLMRQLIGFVMLPIYTNYLSPADYGVASLLVFMTSVFELIFGARFAQAIPRFYFKETNESNRNILISTALSSTAIISLLGVLLVSYYTEPLSQLLFGKQEYSIYIALHSIQLFSIGVEYYGMMYLRLIEKPVIFVMLSLLKLVFQLILNIYFIVFLEYGIMGVVMSAVISSLLFSLCFLVFIYSKCGIKPNLTFAKQLLFYSWPLWLVGAANLYIHSSNRIFIRMFSNLSNVGLFELATKFSMILALLIWQPFSDWWQIESFKILNDKQSRKNQFQMIFDILVTVMALFAFGISIFSQPVIYLMSAVEFHESSKAIFPLVFSILFFNLFLFFNFCYMASDKTLSLAYLKFGSAFFITLLYIALIPMLGFLGASYAALITNFFLFLASFHFGQKLTDLKIKLNYFIIVIIITIFGILIDNILLELNLSILNSILIKLLLSIILIFCYIVLMMYNPNTSSIVKSFVKRINIFSFKSIIKK